MVEQSPGLCKVLSSAVNNKLIASTEMAQLVKSLLCNPENPSPVSSTDLKTDRHSSAVSSCREIRDKRLPEIF